MKPGQLEVKFQFPKVCVDSWGGGRLMNRDQNPDCKSESRKGNNTSQEGKTQSNA